MPLRDATPLRLTRLLHGGDYNPDQWSEEIQEEDARLMQLARWNIATLPVFSWAHLEPSEGVYDFDWLDRAIERLSRAGVDLCLATATASTPAWVSERYPDVLTVDEQGRRKPHGNRHAFCPNSPSFRRLAGALVEKIGMRYAHHPRLVLWHVSNEYGGNWPNYCYCERCASAFRLFLERRYGDLAGLNAAWTTAFWGHTYSSWSQIDPPYAHGERSIPAMQIDWRRFQSQSYLECFEHEASILRGINPKVPITTNLMGAFFALDYQAWAPALDVVSWDNYPQPDTHFTRVAFGHALTRGLRHGQPFLLLEQSPSHQNWSPYCRLKPPGHLRLLSLQAVAHGAESVMYFQWRKSRGGIEQLHGAVVEHHGRSDARVFREVSAIGAELEALGARTLGGRTPARAAVLFDWECWWALAASSGPSRDFDYHAEVVSHYAALHARGIQTDIIGPLADLSGYELIVLPLAFMLRNERADVIASRVRAGATLVAGFFTGAVDENDRGHAGGAPGPLAQVLGVRVEEYDALPRDVAQSVRFNRALGSISAGASEPASLICERVWLEGAQPLASYGREFYAGEPAITVNTFGSGKAYYLGTRLAEGSLSALLGAICAERGIESPLGVTPPAGVEVTARVSPGGETLLYLLNHALERREVPLPPGQFVNLLAAGPSRAEDARAVLQAIVTLEPRGVCVLAPA